MFRRLLPFLTLLLLAGRAVALDDPMRPPDYGAATTAAAAGTASAVPLVLNGTLIGRERRSAVINGRRVSVGDYIDGARVIEIQPAQVRLQRQGSQLTLSLLPVAVKTPVSAK